MPFLSDEERREYHRSRYAYLKSLGLCTHCGMENMKENRTRCEPCLDKQRLSQQKLRGGRKNGTVIQASNN